MPEGRNLGTETGVQIQEYSLADTSTGKEPWIAVAWPGSYARLASCPRIVQGKAGYRRVVGRVGRWTSVDRFADYNEVQVVDEEGEVPPEYILSILRGVARCQRAGGRGSLTKHPVV